MLALVVELGPAVLNLPNFDKRAPAVYADIARSLVETASGPFGLGLQGKLAMVGGQQVDLAAQGRLECALKVGEEVVPPPAALDTGTQRQVKADVRVGDEEGRIAWLDPLGRPISLRLAGLRQALRDPARLAIEPSARTFAS